MPERFPPLSCNMWLIQYYFLNLFRPITAKPTKPEPKRNIVAGSGSLSRQKATAKRFRTSYNKMYASDREILNQQYLLALPLH
jgi:hypothetical protein